MLCTDNTDNTYVVKIMVTDEDDSPFYMLLKDL